MIFIEIVINIRSVPMSCMSSMHVWELSCYPCSKLSPILEWLRHQNCSCLSCHTLPLLSVFVNSSHVSHWALCRVTYDLHIGKPPIVNYTLWKQIIVIVNISSSRPTLIRKEQDRDTLRMCHIFDSNLKEI